MTKAEQALLDAAVANSPSLRDFRQAVLVERLGPVEAEIRQAVRVLLTAQAELARFYSVPGAGEDGGLIDRLVGEERSNLMLTHGLAKSGRGCSERT